MGKLRPRETQTCALGPRVGRKEARTRVLACSVLYLCLFLHRAGLRGWRPHWVSDCPLGGARGLQATTDPRDDPHQACWGLWAFEFICCPTPPPMRGLCPGPALHCPVLQALHTRSVGAGRGARGPGTGGCTGRRSCLPPAADVPPLACCFGRKGAAWRCQ